MDYSGDKQGKCREIFLYVGFALKCTEIFAAWMGFHNCLLPFEERKERIERKRTIQDMRIRNKDNIAKKNFKKKKKDMKNLSKK